MLPRRAPGSPFRTNDQWSLLRDPATASVATPARRPAASNDRCTGSPAPADPTGTTDPTPTRSMASIARRPDLSARVIEAT